MVCSQSRSVGMGELLPGDSQVPVLAGTFMHDRRGPALGSGPAQGPSGSASKGYG